MDLDNICKVLTFDNFGDKRGNLIVIEGGFTIPFEIKRVFYIFGTTLKAIRGQHANRYSEFVLINVSGKSKVKLSNGKNELVVVLDKPSKGVYIPKMIWKEMYDFSDDSVLMVLASSHYDSSEYIKSYAEYKAIMLEMEKKRR